MTQPGPASRPHASPIASVSSGLCEMSVAMNVQSPRAVLVAEAQARFADDLSDASQRQIGKPFLPRIEQRHGVLARDCEQQFEIFPVRERCEQRSLGGGFSTRSQFRFT